VEEVLEEEIARVEECARRAAERAERMADKMRRRGERIEQKARRRAARVATAYRHGTLLRRQCAPAGDLQQERLAVLKMLAEGKINAEQAEALLSALES
jgi:phytoene/squalene synthetase